MTNPFQDQAKFMTASGQTVAGANFKQFELYYSLVKEEMAELMEAHTNGNDVEQLDALIDIIVVSIGAMHSMGVDVEAAWNEVMKSNLAKIDPATGMVTKRADGKILKPEGWQPPNLSQFF